MPTLLMSVVALVLLAVAPGFAGDTICADTLITGSHDNVIVPTGTVCESSAYIAGNVKVFGGFHARGGTLIEGNIEGEPGHAFVRLHGVGVVVRGNVQLKKSGSFEPSGFLPGTQIGGSFHWEESAGSLVARGGTIGGNFVMEKSSGGGEISDNVIHGNLHCKENDPPPTGGGNAVAGNMEGQCSSL